MIRRARAFPLLLSLLSVGALAGVWGAGNPGLRWPRESMDGVWGDGNPGLHGLQRALKGLVSTVRPAGQGQRPPALPGHARLSGPVYAVHAVDLSGEETTLDIEPDLDLGDPLPVLDGAVELVVELAGPATLTLPGGRPTPLAVTELHVVLADPEDAAERGAVTLEPDGDGWIGLGW